MNIVPATQKRKRFVLIDDDKTYRSIMQRCAEQRGTTLDVYDSLEDLGSIGLLANYDGAIVDYDLGSLKGTEIAEYLATWFKKVPMVLISSSPREPSGKPWPRSIKRFVQKSEGYEYVFQQLERCLDEPSWDTAESRIRALFK